ncbi:GTP cyclohydrolase II [Massilia sp. G4R7]|uniref:GTP cyclohydrolase-2 n=1 Tax=Massilia phyllostachyos TaxID=2898585 RepID=A0ABS8QAC9_9BURK|nr:GTP cyclohydrolase II [Massilia phyllostachyos]MCD2518684.1 GTP cyclohydrolase II [Massilia phyllostachyos]
MPATSATPATAATPAANDQLLDYVTSCALPTPWAQFTLHAFVEHTTGKEHLAMVLGDIGDGEPVLARVHSECLTGDVLFSQRCDCGAQLEGALQRIAQEGRGILLYLRQEGRGIGLLNKIRAYRLQEAGADTVEANLQLGFHADARNYELCLPMLAQFGVRKLRLMTNNPRKIDALTRLGIEVTDRVPLLVNRNAYNNSYLNTKQAKLGHMMTPPAAVPADQAPAPAATPDVI